MEVKQPTEAHEAPDPRDKREAGGFASFGATVYLTRIVIVGRTDLLCRAPHPSPRYQGLRIHGARIGTIPFVARPTGRILDREEDVRPGFVPAFCSQCKLITEYEVLAPSVEVVEVQREAVPA